MPSDRNQTLLIRRGADFSFSLGYVNQDLTGYTARMMLREEYDSETPSATLTTENGKITITEIEDFVEAGWPAVVAGKTVESLFELVAKIPNAETQDLEKPYYVYDLELISPAGVVYRDLEGRAETSPNATR